MWSQLEVFVPRTAPVLTQPAVSAYIQSSLASRRARKVAAELLSHLLDSYQRFGIDVPILEASELDASAARFGGDSEHPVTGWRYGLPIPLPAPERARVSRILGVVVGAIEARRRTSRAA